MDLPLPVETRQRKKKWGGFGFRKSYVGPEGVSRNWSKQTAGGVYFVKARKGRG